LRWKTTNVGEFAKGLVGSLEKRIAVLGLAFKSGHAARKGAPASTARSEYEAS